MGVFNEMQVPGLTRYKVSVQLTPTVTSTEETPGLNLLYLLHVQQPAGLGSKKTIQKALSSYFLTLRKILPCLVV